MRTAKPITAQELMEKLQSGPEWVARESKRVGGRERERLAIRAEQEPVRADLHRVGVTQTNLGHVLHSPKIAPKAIPVLLKH